MRRDLSLPDGYRVREVEGYLYLFDADGIPLIGPTDAPTIEAYAWRDTWRRIDRELHEELEALGAGARPLHELRRLRQYMRMLDAVGHVSRAEERRPVPRVTVRWVALAASAAAVAAVFLMTFSRIVGVPENPAPPVAPSRFATAPFATPPAATLPAPRSGSAGGVRAVVAGTAGAAPHGPVRAAHAVRRRSVVVGYAVSFGDFASRAIADTMMHVIRRKGYVVHVASLGEDSQVVTRPYHTRRQAERLVHALKEIGLPAELAAIRPL